MPLTSTGQLFIKTANAPESFLRKTTRWGVTHPLAAGVTALGVASGDQSVGEAVGMGMAGSAGWFGAERALQQVPTKMPNLYKNLARAGRFMPGWMKPVGMFAGSMAGAVAAGEAGRHIGSRVPIWQRNAPETY